MRARPATSGSSLAARSAWPSTRSTARRRSSRRSQQCEEFANSELRDRQVQGLIMCKLAQLRAMNGDFESARTMYHQARAMLDDLGQTVRAATSSYDLGMVELLAGDPAAAERAVRADYDTLCSSAQPTSCRRWPASWRARCAPGPRRGSARADPHRRSGGGRRRRRRAGPVARHPRADPRARGPDRRSRSARARRRTSGRARPRCRACTASRSSNSPRCCNSPGGPTKRALRCPRRRPSTTRRATSSRPRERSGCCKRWSAVVK